MLVGTASTNDAEPTAGITEANARYVAFTISASVNKSFTITPAEIPVSMSEMSLE